MARLDGDVGRRGEIAPWRSGGRGGRGHKPPAVVTAVDERGGVNWMDETGRNEALAAAAGTTVGMLGKLIYRAVSGSKASCRTEPFPLALREPSLVHPLVLWRLTSPSPFVHG